MLPTSPLGPIWRAVINALWARLFDPAPTNQLYLPRILREGYKPWDLPPYDPTTPGGESDAFPLPGIPQEVADSACKSMKPIKPIASSAPQLRLSNVLLTNLSQMLPHELKFSDSDPRFTGVVTIGTADKPLTLSPSNPDEHNYRFEVACCVPDKIGSRTCSPDHWPVDAKGHFTATGTDAHASITLQLNANGSAPVTATVINIGVAAEPRNVKVSFDVKDLPQWAQQMAQMAIQEGVGSGAIVNALNNFLNQDDVKKHLETLIDNALKNFSQADLSLAMHQ